MFEKHLWESDILNLYLNLYVTFTQVFFKHFAGKSQLPGFYMNRTLVENMLMYSNITLHQMVYNF